MSKDFFDNIPLGSLLFHQFRVISQLHVSDECGVFLASDERSRNTLVALKIFSTEALIATGRIDDVAREVEIAQAVVHKNIAQCFDTYQDDDFIAISVAYYSGGTLAHRLASRSRFSFDEVSHVLKQLAAGVEALHDQRILHRDIKPENILVDERETLKIADFGIALYEEEAPFHVGERMHGTIEYMSPEYIRSGLFSYSSDIYALGVIAYRMLTGKLPFEGEDVVDLLAIRVLSDPTDVREMRRDCPPHLAAIVMKALARREDERFSSCSKLLKALNGEPLEEESWLGEDALIA
jgi:serine/threonine protein kinase